MEDVDRPATEHLAALRDGDARAAAKLLPLVYDELRVLGVLLKGCEAMSYAHDKGVIQDGRCRVHRGDYSEDGDCLRRRHDRRVLTPFGASVRSDGWRPARTLVG